MVACGIGEVLWDIFAEGELFGGAALNFCANLQRLGNRAILLSAVGEDAHGQAARETMTALGLTTEGIRTAPDLPTGTATVTTGDNGEPAFLIPRPAAFDEVHVSPQLRANLKASEVAWVYYGTLMQTSPETERLTAGLIADLRPARGFYDINLRPGQWNLALVQRLSRFASVMKLNEGEAETLFGLTSDAGAVFSLERFCEKWAALYGIEVICVTLGPLGCLIYDRGSFHRVLGYRVSVVDTVGAGDAFAAAFLHGYHLGWGIVRAARFANALGALVAGAAGATPPWTMDQVIGLMGGESGRLA